MIKNFKWKDFWAPATFITVLGFAVAFGQYIQRLDERTPQSVEMRVRLEDHMLVWTEETTYGAFARLKAVEDTVIVLERVDSMAKVERNQARIERKEINTKLNLILQILKDK